MGRGFQPARTFARSLLLNPVPNPQPIRCFRPGLEVILRMFWESTVFGRCTDLPGGHNCVNLLATNTMGVIYDTPNLGFGPQELPGV